MKAVFFEHYGPPEVLQYSERPRPEPRADQVLIEVHAVAVNPRDWLLREGRYQFRHLLGGFPIIPGSDVSGVIVATGKDVQGFRQGDEVFAMQSMLGRMGGYAEYVAVKEVCLARKPNNVTHAQAAAVPCAGLTSWQALLKNGKMKQGDKVVVVGASGGVGHYAVQIARHFGAHVIGVCSTANVEFVKSLGAHEVIDYKKEKFNERLRDCDIVYDTIGRESLATCAKVLNPNGVYITTIPNGRTAVEWLTTSLRHRLSQRGQRASVIMCEAAGADLAEMAALMNHGKLRSQIDQTFPLKDAIEAHRKSRSFRTRGKLVLTVK
ncbi:MAG: NAD(P)-dependent alcohol dehydrogenase [Nevskiales bacterium]